MTARKTWSASRLRTALQCGRRLQASEEGWERAEHIRGIRGRAVHSAIERIEGARGSEPILDVVVDSWYPIVPDTADHEGALDAVRSLWTDDEVMAHELDALEAQIEADNPGRYKAIRSTKAFREGAAAIRERHGLDKALAEVEATIDGLEWPWDTDRGIYDEGLAHSLETVRRGAGFLRDLWPEPDIIGAEWHLRTELPNGYEVHGYIDRVEISAGTDIVDYKSSEFQETELDHWFQAAVYAVIAEDHLGYRPDRVRFVYLRDRKSVAFEVRPEWRDALARQVEAADRRLAGRDFAPTFSGCGICPYIEVCRSEFPMLEAA